MMKQSGVVARGARALLVWAAAWAALPLRTAAGAASTDDWMLVKARILEEVRQHPADTKRARADAASQSANGAWPDVDYSSTHRTRWAPMEHLNRLTRLAEAWDAHGLSDPEHQKIAAAFTKGFDFWLARDPKSLNWWYNEIGAPQSLYRLMLLAEPLLTDGRLEKGCDVLSRAKLGMSGQNLVWLAENVIGRACLQRDPALMADAFRRIEAEAAVTDKEGVQPDFSFHQHGAQLYSGGYGNGFAASVPRFALLAQDTSFAFPHEKIRIVENYLLDGQQWMIRGRQFDYSASGRELSRPNSGRAGGYAVDARNVLKLGAAARRDELARFAERIEKGTQPLCGHRHFWCSDYTVHHAVDWMVSVRLTSDRLQQTELINGENLLGEHLSDGVMFIYLSGDEYRNIFPVWDWARLPGITVERDRPLAKIDNRRRGTRAFAGGVSDGRCGVSAMDFERGGLRAKKGWFFFDKETVCLGAGIASSNDCQVITSVNQCLARGAVTVKRADEAASVLAVPENLTTPRWIHHDGVGYVFLDSGAGVGSGASVQTGCWKRVSSAQTADPVQERIFSLWINHGRRPMVGTYGYVVVPSEVADIETYAAAVPVKVLVNASSAQAVEETRTGMLQIAFYEAGRVSSPSWGAVAADAPCLLLLSREGEKRRLTVCDPARKVKNLCVAVGKEKLSVRLPDGPRAGTSVGASFH